jgi:sulfite reductase alpha subunit-like flavoprotein
MYEFWVPQAIEYDTGDVLEILPGQDSAAVDAFIRRCNLDPDSLITVSLLRLVNVRLYIKNILILTYIEKRRLVLGKEFNWERT